MVNPLRWHEEHQAQQDAVQAVSHGLLSGRSGRVELVL
ncbi:hypothetical protein NY08_1044 [Rhodococcus sp. B7740]|nr:hypothetical protein NY08_1044 [Rhodococcus sp. B7740]